MDIDKISRTVLNAYNNHLPVLVQTNNLKYDVEGNIIGFIDGYLDDGTIVIKDKLIKISDITSIKIGLGFSLTDPIKDLNAAEITKNMRYYTLLHFLSAYLFRKYGAKVTSSAIEDDHARLEVQFPADNIPKYFNQDLITKNTHKLIAKDMPVSSEIVDRSSLSDERLIRTYTNLIPKQITRIIDDYDEQACGGIHVKSTAEIGKFKFTALKNHGHLRKRIKVALL